MNKLRTGIKRTGVIAEIKDFSDSNFPKKVVIFENDGQSWSVEFRKSLINAFNEGTDEGKLVECEFCMYARESRQGNMNNNLNAISYKILE
jgi:hypothetical protein